MAVYVVEIKANGTDENEDFLEIERSPSAITIKEIREKIEKRWKGSYTSAQYHIIIKDAAGEEEEIAFAEWDDKTLSDVLENDDEEATIYVYADALADETIEVTNLVDQEIPFITGATKRWQDYDLPANAKSVPIAICKARFWRKSNTKKGRNSMAKIQLSSTS